MHVAGGRRRLQDDGAGRAVGRTGGDHMRKRYLNGEGGVIAGGNLH